MKKLLVAVLVIALASGVAFAGGDKNHADKAEGPAGDSNPGVADSSLNSRD